MRRLIVLVAALGTIGLAGCSADVDGKSGVLGATSLPPPVELVTPATAASSTRFAATDMFRVPGNSVVIAP